MAAAAEPMHELLQDLRPGDSVETVKTSFGERWQDPLPHRAGRVLRIAASHGVVVDIDVRDRLGRIAFDWRFGEKYQVAGLKIGASKAEVLSTYPDMKFGSTTMTRHIESGSLLLRPGLRLFVELNSGSIRRIELANPEAVYPARAPLVLPPVVGVSGAPFKDPNLKLAVLSELVERAEIDLGEPEDFLSALLSHKVDIERSGYVKNDAAYDYLIRYPLTQELLDKVSDLVVDGGNEIYRYVWYFWDGETDDFDIRSFEGIGKLRNLKKLRLISLVDQHRVDLAPLQSIPGLQYR
ncbi:DUF6892 domain-containing protein [Telmatospirillum sp.]|uniref:DUF6892 domain-containing protein n=1 Tax=Telmatospirillum sp. TaxID=2079197 RepID=UPI00284036DE|nr:hypothetical protein [Telmatospirillum sp.]MDR3437864.1 hypothetical protein [Telmatospirillum sp.]